MPRLGGVWDEVAAGESELVVVGDAGGECEQAYADADAEVVEGSGSVAFESEGAFGGLDDRFDALAHAGDDGCLSGFGLAVRSDDRGAEFGRGGFELAAGVALVGDHGLPAVQSAGEQRDRDLAFSALGGPQRRGARGAVQRGEQMQPHSVEEPRMRGAVAVAGGVPDRVGQGAVAGAFDRLARAGGLDRGGVQDQHVVVVAGALGSEHADQPLDARFQAGSALVERVLGRDLREQMRQAAALRRRGTAGRSRGSRAEPARPRA